MRNSFMAFADWVLPAMPYLTVMPIILPAFAAGLIMLFRGCLLYTSDAADE